MTDPVSAIRDVAPAQPQNAAVAATSKDYNMFLQLLVAQMKHQDPLSPMDPTQFVSQIATFTQVEQLTQANQRIGELGQMFAGSLARMDLGYIGMDVESKISVFKHDGISGSDFRYVTDGADTVEIAILDKDGNAVRTVAGNPATGEQTFAWDGNDDSGNPVPAGDYKIDVRAKGIDGKDIQSVVSMRGIVREVITENGVSVLVYDNGTMVDSGMVVAVKSAV